MCSHLLKAGYTASIYNRSPKKMDSLVAMGAKPCASPKEVAQKSDVIFSIVGFPTDVEEVLLGDDGAIAGLRPGCVMVDMTTSRPMLAQEIYRRAKEVGVASLDAP
ncbi:MAG: NAD(P)-dependent oxidoreductase, partial [bacterium]